MFKGDTGVFVWTHTLSHCPMYFRRKNVSIILPQKNCVVAIITELAISMYDYPSLSCTLQFHCNSSSLYSHHSSLILLVSSSLFVCTPPLLIHILSLSPLFVPFPVLNSYTIISLPHSIPSSRRRRWGWTELWEWAGLL